MSCRSRVSVPFSVCAVQPYWSAKVACHIVYPLPLRDDVGQVLTRDPTHPSLPLVPPPPPHERGVRMGQRMVEASVEVSMAPAILRSSGLPAGDLLSSLFKWGSVNVEGGVIWATPPADARVPMPEPWGCLSAEDAVARSFAGRIPGRSPGACVCALVANAGPGAVGGVHRALGRVTRGAWGTTSFGQAGGGGGAGRSGRAPKAKGLGPNGGHMGAGEGQGMHPTHVKHHDPDASLFLRLLSPAIASAFRVSRSLRSNPRGKGGGALLYPREVVRVGPGRPPTGPKLPPPPPGPLRWGGGGWGIMPPGGTPPSRPPTCWPSARGPGGRCVEGGPERPPAGEAPVRFDGHGPQGTRVGPTCCDGRLPTDAAFAAAAGPIPGGGGRGGTILLLFSQPFLMTWRPLT